MRSWSGDVVRRFRPNPLRFEIPGFTNVVEISAGGFSTVYRACQPQLSRTVAIKVLDPRGLDKQDLFRRFERECKTLGMLGDHPNVVRVFQAGVSASGNPYIVMEYLPAGSLAGRLDADGPLSWEAALAIGVKLAGALESAHQAGILHLDVKPANLMVGPDGEPKLADFGIARVRAALGATTQTLALTAGYAEPERFEEGELTASADVYGLGVTLFTLLAGCLPFLCSKDEHPRPEVILGRQLFGPVPELILEFPEGLRAVVRRAMAKSPTDRYESAAELGESLQEVQREQGLAVTPLLVVPVTPIPPGPQPAPVRRRRSAVACLLLVVTLVAGLVGVAVWPDPDTCARAKTVQADGVLSFGTLLPRTGQFLYSGPALQAGAQLAIKDVNDAGGIPGINVQLDQANQRDSGDGASTSIARKSIDELLSAGVDVVIGAGTSPVTRSVIDKIVCAGVMMFAPSNTVTMFSTYPDHGLYFRTAPLTVLEGAVLGELVVADGNSTAVVMARDDLFGNDLRQQTVKGIEEFGGKVLDSFSYNPGAPQHDRDIQRIKAKNPDAIVLIGFTESAPILRKMIEQGLGPKNKRVYGVGANTTNTLPGQVNPRDPGVLAGMKGTPLDTGGDTFAKRLSEVRPGLQDLTYAPQVYDAVVITALAAAVARTDAPAALAEQVNGVTKDGEKCVDFSSCMDLIKARRDIDYDGVSGPLEFTDSGEPSSGTYVISEIQADGSLKPIRTITAGGAT